MPQLPQHAQGGHRPAFDPRLKPAQLIDARAQAAELLAEHLGRERVTLGLCKLLLRLDAARRSRAGLDGNAQLAADGGFHRQIQRHAALGTAAGKRLAQAAVDLRIVGLPKLLAGLQAVEIEGIAAEGQFDPAAGNFFERELAGEDFVDAAALVVGFAQDRRKGNAVAAPQRRGELDRHAIAVDGRDLADADAAVGRVAAVDDLQIPPGEPALREAAREGAFQLQQLLRRRD